MYLYLLIVAVTRDIAFLISTEVFTPDPKLTWSEGIRKYSQPWKEILHRSLSSQRIDAHYSIPKRSCRHFALLETSSAGLLLSKIILSGQLSARECKYLPE